MNNYRMHVYLKDLQLSERQKKGDDVQSWQCDFREERYLEKDLEDKEGIWLVKERSILDIRKVM